MDPNQNKPINQYPNNPMQVNNQQPFNQTQGSQSFGKTQGLQPVSNPIPPVQPVQNQVPQVQAPVQQQPFNQTQGLQSFGKTQGLQPVSNPVREQGPVVNSSPSNEYITPSTPELILKSDVKEAGVEVKSEIPQIPEDAQNAGLVHAKEATEVTPIIQKNLSLQSPKQQVFNILHVHKKVKESIRWLATLIVRQFKVQEGKGMTT